jgi:hypothetical protein
MLADQSAISIAKSETGQTWSLEVAGRRACRPLGGAQPLVVFQATERPVLLVLPAEPYELAVWATPKVAADCHISVDGALYSVPRRLVGRRVDVRCTPPGRAQRCWARTVFEARLLALLASAVNDRSAISSAWLTRRPHAVCWWGPGARHPSLGVAWP